jgi:hypothetical protein
LTRAEQADLEQQEAMIARGLQIFWEVGPALSVIRDRQLFRQEYPSFAAYLQRRWQLSRFYAHRMIEAATVREELLPIGNALPENEAQVRPLTRLKDAEARRQAWEEVAQQAAAGKPITAALVRRVVTGYAPTTAPGLLPAVLPPSMAEPQTVADAERLLLESARRYGKASREGQAGARAALLRAAKSLVELEQRSATEHRSAD